MPLKIYSCPLQPVAPDAERSWIRKKGRAHAKAAELASAVRNADFAGRRLSPVMRNAIKHPLARLSATLKALGGSPCREEALALMSRVNAWEESYDPIRWYAKRKSTVGERYICLLPDELKAVHYLLKRPLEKLLTTDSNIYGVKGRGRDDLAREIKDLQNQGFNSIAVTDIVDCYQSVDPDAVYQLPLPKEVIRRTLDLRNQILVEHDNGGQPQACFRDTVLPYDTTQKARGPRGLMQGSPLSGLILAWLLNGMPSREQARVYLCFDNLIVLARSPSEVRATIDTLVAHFEQCSAGPLALCDPIYADNLPAHFLGYLFDPGHPGIGINMDDRNRLLRKLNDAEADQARRYQEIAQLHGAQRELTLSGAYNPFTNHFPAQVWDVLRSFRAGFPAASSNAPELLGLLDNSRWLAEWTGDYMTTFYHDNLFSERNVGVDQAIRAIIKRQKGE